MNFYQLRELGASGKEDIITSCLQSEPNALNVVFLIDVFSNLCSYLVLYIHNSLIYVGNCKSRRFVSGRVSFLFFELIIKIFTLRYVSVVCWL